MFKSTSKNGHLVTESLESERAKLLKILADYLIELNENLKVQQGKTLHLNLTNKGKLSREQDKIDFFTHLRDVVDPSKPVTDIDLNRWMDLTKGFDAKKSAYKYWKAVLAFKAREKNEQATNQSSTALNNPVVTSSSQPMPVANAKPIGGFLGQIRARQKPEDTLDEKHGAERAAALPIEAPGRIADASQRPAVSIDTRASLLDAIKARGQLGANEVNTASQPLPTRVVAGELKAPNKPTQGPLSVSLLSAIAEGKTQLKPVLKSVTDKAPLKAENPSILASTMAAIGERRKFIGGLTSPNSNSSSQKSGWDPDSASNTPKPTAKPPVKTSSIPQTIGGSRQVAQALKKAQDAKKQATGSSITPAVPQISFFSRAPTKVVPEGHNPSTQPTVASAAITASNTSAKNGFTNNRGPSKIAPAPARDAAPLALKVPVSNEASKDSPKTTTAIQTPHTQQAETIRKKYIKRLKGENPTDKSAYINKRTSEGSGGCTARFDKTKKIDSANHLLKVLEGRSNAPSSPDERYLPALKNKRLGKLTEGFVAEVNKAEILNRCPAGVQQFVTAYKKAK